MKFLADVGKFTWSSQGGPSFNDIMCEIGFRENDELPVTFSLPLEFGMRFYDSERTLLREVSLPAFGEEYLSTDQDYVYAENIYDLSADSNYTVYVWAKYGDNEFSSEYPIKTLQYLQPYPQWSYNEETKQWEPPFPPPQDGYKYKWAPNPEVWVRSLGYNEEAQAMEYSIYDEQLQEWVPYEFPKVDE
jgi:hypothetical protein